MLAEQLAGPLVIGSRAGDDLQLVARRQQRQVLIAIARRLAGVGGLQVDDPAHPGVEARDIHRAAGLERHQEARLAKRLEQARAGPLCQRLATGHADMAHCAAPGQRDQLGQRDPLPAMKRVCGVAVDAAKRTAGEPDEESWPADRVGLALDRDEGLGDLQPHRGWRRPDGGASRLLSGSQRRSTASQRPSASMSVRRWVASLAASVSG
jgi:hypothetical protein